VVTAINPELSDFGLVLTEKLLIDCLGVVARVLELGFGAEVGNCSEDTGKLARYLGVVVARRTVVVAKVATHPTVEPEMMAWVVLDSVE
jgi:hypothetical protein